MSLSPISNGESGSSARTKINAAISAINLSANPRVIYVTTAGNDTTGDGSPGAPYLTAQKAWDVALAGAGDYVLHIGVMTQTINVTAAWPSRITLTGYYSTTLSINSTGFALDITSNGLMRVDISCVGAAVRLKNCRGALCQASGVVGATGEAGTPGDPENAGGDGGLGGNGGNGPPMTLLYCEYDVVESLGGAGGPGGPGGADGGMGSGNSGSAGSDGARGEVYLFASSIGTVRCYYLYFAQTNIANTDATEPPSDLGGNSSMTIPA